MTARLTVLYGRDADAYLVARDADRALEGSGYLVSVEQAGDGDEVWITRRGTTNSTQFLPGQLLVVTHDDGWRIEDSGAGADHMPVLQALLAPMHPAIPPHGNQHSSAWSQARTEWLDQVRAWVAEQGRVLASRNVSADDQRAYVEATGDYFRPPEGER